MLQFLIEKEIILIGILKRIYNYKINDFDENEIVRIRIGNLLAVLGFGVSILYSFLYLFYINSFAAFFLTLVFAILYLGYFYFLSKMEIFKARLSFFLTIFIQISSIVIFFVSSKSGIQYYLLLVPPLAYLVFSKEKELRLSLSLLALLLLIITHFFGENYYILELEKSILNTLYVLTLIILFFVFIILFNAFLEEIEQKEEKLEHLSKTDFLTDILNRRAFYKKADEMTKLSNRYGNDLGLLIFDIDYFKKINDKYGHNIGDIVLQKISKEVSSSIRDTDCFARFGGEEFIILLPNISKEQLLLFAEKIRKLIENIEIKYTNKEKIKFTISIGVTVYYKNDTIEKFIDRADIAMYESKEKGRNTSSSMFLSE